VRFWILVSILLTPMAARAADECPVSDGWYRRWVNCESRLKPMDESSRERVRAMVDAHTIESGSAVTWEEETEAVFDLLPEDLRQRPALDYIQCREFEEGRICKSDWEARDRCITIREGSTGMEFSPGTAVDVSARSAYGVDFRAESAPLPSGATTETSGEVRVEDGRLRWELGYARGSAHIAVPESAGPWTLSFEALATRGDDAVWHHHPLGYATGSPSPLERQLRPEAYLTISWTCPE
jgi:hypothetical protein